MQLLCGRVASDAASNYCGSITSSRISPAAKPHIVRQCQSRGSYTAKQVIIIIQCQYCGSIQCALLKRRQNIESNLPPRHNAHSQTVMPFPFSASAFRSSIRQRFSVFLQYILYLSICGFVFCEALVVSQFSLTSLHFDVLIVRLL